MNKNNTSYKDLIYFIPPLIVCVSVFLFFYFQAKNVRSGYQERIFFHESDVVLAIKNNRNEAKRILAQYQNATTQKFSCLSMYREGEITQEYILTIAAKFGGTRVSEISFRYRL